MIRHFDVQETVVYNHRITIEIDESQEEQFDDYGESVAIEMENGDFDSIEQIVILFTEEFGEDAVNFIEDGSPDVTYESW